MSTWTRPTWSCQAPPERRHQQGSLPLAPPCSTSISLPAPPAWVSNPSCPSAGPVTCHLSPEGRSQPGGLGLLSAGGCRALASSSPPPLLHHPDSKGSPCPSENGQKCSVDSKPGLSSKMTVTLGGTPPLHPEGHSSVPSTPRSPGLLCPRLPSHNPSLGLPVLATEVHTLNRTPHSCLPMCTVFNVVFLLPGSEL